MARLSTCKNCGKKISNEEEKKKIKGKNYCLECYNKLSYESEQYKSLINTIYELSKSSGGIPPMVYKQIKEYKEEFGFEYYGIQYTIWYIVNILNINLNIREYGIAMVQYEYNQAENWYINQQKIQNQFKTTKDNKLQAIKTSNKFVTFNSKSKELFNLDNLF